MLSRDSRCEHAMPGRSVRIRAVACLTPAQSPSPARPPCLLVNMLVSADIDQPHAPSCRGATNASSPSRGGGGPAGWSIFFRVHPLASATVSSNIEMDRWKGGHIPGSSARAAWRPARSRPAQCTTAAAGAPRCSSTCRGGCWSSTPSSSCPGAPCRCTWPAAARVLVGCGVCRPVGNGGLVGLDQRCGEGAAYHFGDVLRTE